VKEKVMCNYSPRP